MFYKVFNGYRYPAIFARDGVKKMKEKWKSINKHISLTVKPKHQQIFAFLDASDHLKLNK